MYCDCKRASLAAFAIQMLVTFVPCKAAIRATVSGCRLVFVHQGRSGPVRYRPRARELEGWCVLQRSSCTSSASESSSWRRHDLKLLERPCVRKEPSGRLSGRSSPSRGLENAAAARLGSRASPQDRGRMQGGHQLRDFEQDPCFCLTWFGQGQWLLRIGAFGSAVSGQVLFRGFAVWGTVLMRLLAVAESHRCIETRRDMKLRAQHAALQYRFCAGRAILRTQCTEQGSTMCTEQRPSTVMSTSMSM